jgi:hypothetical protein
MAFLTYQLGKVNRAGCHHPHGVRGLRPDLNYGQLVPLSYTVKRVPRPGQLWDKCAARHDLCATSDLARQVGHLPKVDSPRHYGLAAVTSSSLSHFLQGLQNPWRFGFPPQGLGIVILDQYISSQVPAHFISENIRQQSIAGSSPSYSTGVLKGDLVDLHRTQLSGRRNKLRKRCR